MKYVRCKFLYLGDSIVNICNTKEIIQKFVREISLEVLTGVLLRHNDLITNAN